MLNKISKYIQRQFALMTAGKGRRGSPPKFKKLSYEESESQLPKPEHKYGYTNKQVLQICRERKIHHKTFWKTFGVNTCMLDKKLGTIYYPCDVERALYELKKPGGKFHLWD